KQQLEINEALRTSSDLGKDALKGFVSDLRSGKSAGEALQGVLTRIEDKMLDVAVDSLWSGISKGILSGVTSSVVGGSGLLGGLFGHAEGGLIIGPGTGTSDSIPAMLSNGEFVVRADAARQHMAELIDINSGRAGRR